MTPTGRVSFAAALALTVLATPGCKPKYSASGSLSMAGAAFRPTECHVLGARATGIELVDEKGTRIEVTLPPARLDAFQEIGGPREREDHGTRGERAGPRRLRHAEDAGRGLPRRSWTGRVGPRVVRVRDRRDGRARLHGLLLTGEAVHDHA